ncbi:MAG: beta-N-acetylglucosaminidase domain-containing protein [Bacteroidales bacterium]|nr:beta-N-acetylglucosaminidase domain-containing protein [Bacteroidales bacterium]
MKKRFLSVGLLLLGAMTAAAQVSLVNPIPQKVTTTAKAGGETLFDAPAAWHIVCDKARQGSIATKALDEAAPRQDAKARFTLRLGLVGDKAVSKVKKQVPTGEEAYYLHIDQGGATIAAHTDRGLYYGVLTLLGIMSQGKLEACTITDWPDVKHRGVVEGFYGTPWSHEHRLRQLDFYGRHKMNVYIYGPKDDPYHRDHWREPYPDTEAARIRELVDRAKARGVHFYWAIHPGIDIKWTDADRDALVAKLEKMYDLGVRAFAVFFDDIWGEGTKADKQAALLNYVDDNFIAKKHDVAPLIMCPTEYNRSWASDKGGYLRTLGTEMNKDVEIMWTGNTVVHCIDKESMQWINQRIDRKGYIWWNFPVSDYVRDHILLGPTYGNGLDIASDISGFVSNPMQHAEASKIALYGVADYTWNMRAYDYQKDWEAALAEILPNEKEALRTFALYNKALGPNGHSFAREEGDELKDLAAKALTLDDNALKEIGTKCRQLAIASDILLADKTNPWLIKELKPWLLQGKNVAAYGEAVVAMATQGVSEFTTYYKQARSLRQQMFELENADVRHPFQPGIKVATGVLLPTLDKIFAQSVDRYNKAHQTALERVAEYNPFTLTATVGQLAHQPVSLNGQEVSIRPLLEVVNWPADASITLEADREFTLQGMDFNLGVKDVARHFTLEVRRPSGEWQRVSLLHYSADDPVIHTGNELGGMTGTAIRLTNTSGAEQQVYFKSFKFVKQ